MKRNYLYFLLALCVGAVVMSCQPKDEPGENTDDPKHPHIGETELDEFSPVGTIGMIDGREGIIVDLGDTLGRVIIATMNVGATATTGEAGYGDYMSYDDAVAMSQSQSWGNGWYLPSKDELKALSQHLKLGKTGGYQWPVTSSSILYFPRAGEYNEKGNLVYNGSVTYIASCTEKDSYFWDLELYPDTIELNGNFKNSKVSVRLFHSLPAPANAIDLGLPSGTLWAAMNVGATTITQHGDLYAWGEIETKEHYTWETYKWCEDDTWTLTKYCSDPTCGNVDNKIVLDPEDDIVHVRWGDNWRLPYDYEWQELIDNCTFTPTRENGVLGLMVTGKNGHSIFLCSEEGEQFVEYTSRCLSLILNHCLVNFRFNFFDNSISVDRCGRQLASHVRPVLSYKVHSGKQN